MGAKRRKRRTLDERLADIEARIAELRHLTAAKRRFSAGAVLKHRNRLGLTGAQYASLLGVSARLQLGGRAIEAEARAGSPVGGARPDE
jgi:hypothetical protein